MFDIIQKFFSTDHQDPTTDKNGSSQQSILVATCALLVEMAQISAFFYKDFTEYEPKAAKAHLRPVAEAPLRELKQALASLETWQAEAIHQVIHDVAEALDLKMGKVGMPLRVAVAGCAASPSIDVTLQLLGKDKTLRRIDQALAYIEQRKQAG